MISVCLFAIIVQFLSTVRADTPANCTFDDVRGKWVFSVTESDRLPTVVCTEQEPWKHQITVDLMYPDIVIDEYGNKGFWTMVYNQGFEVVVNGRKYFGYSRYEGSLKNATSICDQTMPGTSHDVLGRHWACFKGKKIESLKHKHAEIPKSSRQKHPYRLNKEFLDEINSVQTLWKATAYDEYRQMLVEEMVQMAGGRTVRHPRTKPTPVTQAIKDLASLLPESFDWRNMGGENFVSPVRNQGSCGSCYAFSSMGMLEARIRVATNNSETPVFSPQDVVECSSYSQGCDGGFPYLVAGKYAEDFGVVDESCTPYTGQDHSCTTPKTCQRYYSTGYRYVGGYYGGCNEVEMKFALRSGPVSVSFEVEDDFFNYKSGIYKHTGLEDKFNPFELTNHAVLLVGWGEENDVPYWIVKNSWGENWGEQGYFRIIRGQDECSIESIAVETFPIF